MNSNLEKWLSEKQAKEKQIRDAFLIEQGLVDPAKTKTIFKDADGMIISAEKANERKNNGLRVEKEVVYEPLDLTEAEYNQVLEYAQPRTKNGEYTEFELLKKIAKNTGIVSTIMIVYVILSIIVGIIIATQ